MKEFTFYNAANEIEDLIPSIDDLGEVLGYLSLEECHEGNYEPKYKKIFKITLKIEEISE